MEYIGQLLWDRNWGLGLVTKKKDFDRYEVWWYEAVDGPGEEWYGEVDRQYIKKHIAKNCLDSSDGRAAPL